jgi:hypothetical protein
MMKYIITEDQYNVLSYRRRFEDVKDLVYKNVYLSGNKDKELSWDKIDRDDLMMFIDKNFEEYIKDIFRQENNS